MVFLLLFFFPTSLLLNIFFCFVYFFFFLIIYTWLLSATSTDMPYRSIIIIYIPWILIFFKPFFGQWNGTFNAAHSTINEEKRQSKWIQMYVLEYIKRKPSTLNNFSSGTSSSSFNFFTFLAIAIERVLDC